MAQPVRIAAVGEVVEDVYLPERDAYLGGISVNFARAALAAGARATVFAPIGSDARGRRLRAALAETAIGDRLRELDGDSPEQLIRIGSGGERELCGFCSGVLDNYRLELADLAELESFDLLAFPWSPESAAVGSQILEAHALAGIRKVADFSQDNPTTERAGPASWIAPAADGLDICFVGGGTADVSGLADASSQLDTLVVLTAGADGAFAIRRGRVEHCPSAATHVVDTTGCGDAFQAGFSVAWATGAPISRCLDAGSRAAAQVAAIRGSGQPTAASW